MANFRAKARAVDLLGRGQIADLPTAISELWKNGYDAYGDDLRTTLYPSGYIDNSKPIFVLSDDGKGMDRADILDKWFVLGTDSKSRYESDIKGDETLNKAPRVKMGEKGIGRLAVSYLGSQMLMISKKKNNPLQAVFFDWRILDNFNLFLSDVNIPITSFESIDTINESFRKLQVEFLQNFPKKDLNDDPWKDQLALKESIISDCNNIILPDFIIEDSIKDLLKNPTSSHATRFIIFNPDEQIIELKQFSKKDEQQAKREDDSGDHTISSLIGLFNPFKDNIDSPKTSFWINDNLNGKYNILNFTSFFTPDDFKFGDHYIDGEFDETGKFKGTVRIYNKEIPHTFQPITKDKIKKTSYGSFKIRLGYFAGLQNESLLNEEMWVQYGKKLDRFSGLYIYRDNFRVLPYGRSDNDFLNFEERRGKSAGDAFFAKRRMFGYIDITRKNNPKLIDKSSREGFITNVASRDFKLDLIAFFKDLSKKYFATKAEYSYKEEQKNELIKLALSQKKEHEKDIEARKEFAGKLRSLPNQLDNLENRFNKLISDLKERSEKNNILYEEIEKILAEIEICKNSIIELKLNKPVRFKPTELQTKNYHSYNKKIQLVTKKFEESNPLLEQVRQKLEVQEQYKEFEAKNQFYINTLKNQFDEFQSRLNSVFHKMSRQFNSERDYFIQYYTEKYNAIVPSKIDSQEIAKSTKLLENIFYESREQIFNRVNPYFEHIERLNFEVNEDDLVGYYKMQFEEMKNEWNQTYELAQLGIAVEIIDHQFNTLYSQLQENIKSLKNHLLINRESQIQYKQLDTAFEHLLDNYKLLQPLYRTTGKVKNTITATELKEYLEEFFKTRIEENNIKLNISDSAKEWSINSYESIFKPVLINIVNNAIFWLQSVSEKEILIDVVDDKLLIMNSGEPIDDYLLDDIFKLFFSNRTDGRGIGLYLAKKSLNGIGFDIESTNNLRYNKLNGACFSIFKI